MKAGQAVQHLELHTGDGRHITERHGYQTGPQGRYCISGDNGRVWIFIRRDDGTRRFMRGMMTIATMIMMVMGVRVAGTMILSDRAMMVVIMIMAVMASRLGAITWQRPYPNTVPRLGMLTPGSGVCFIWPQRPVHS
jgi:hypothetical protein